VKSPPFSYRTATSTAEATEVLAEFGAAAAVLAGGQSLLIDLHFRRAHPAVVLDINPAGTDLSDAGAASELGQLRVTDGWVQIGALVRHRQLEQGTAGQLGQAASGQAASGQAASGQAASRQGIPGQGIPGQDAFDDPLARLCALAARHIAHPPVRVRGTFAGSIAWAHPSSEWCALAVAMDAEIVLASTRGTRTVPASRWFTGRHQTRRRPDELVTAVRMPLLGPGTGVGFAEHRRTHASFAMAAALTAVSVTEGRVNWARIGMASAADVPVRARAAESVLAGQPVSEQLVTEAADAAAAAAEPVPEPHCSPAYRRQALRVMVQRSLRQAVFGQAVPGQAVLGQAVLGQAEEPAHPGPSWAPRDPGAEQRADGGRSNGHRPRGRPAGQEPADGPREGPSDRPDGPGDEPGSQDEPGSWA
jgi:carbon-monoxide dehydrogenase medium subunit